MIASLRSYLGSLTAALGAVSIGVIGISESAIAQAFGQQEVNPGNFVVVASPYGSNAYQLLILEQLTNQRRCWSESGTNPTLVDPLLLQFDFTGICSRSTDSNGYSVRMANRDFGLIYQLSVVRRNNDLVLIATNLSNRNTPVLEIGRTNGLPPTGQFAKLNLLPGWRLTKRVQNNQVLGHVYLTSDTLPPGVTASAFPDTQSNWARAYIDAMASRGIISGFEDGTFRPDEAVTRVQFAAIVNKAFANMPAKRGATTFQDVPANFWGLQAIQAAYQKGFMSGYPEGTFKPNQRIPKLEVLVSLASGLGLGSQNTTVLSYYQDAAQIPSWASAAIAGATERQIVVNYPRVKELSPNREATRAEVAAFVYQALVNAGQVPNIPSPYVVVVNSTSPSFAPNSFPPEQMVPAPAPVQPNFNTPTPAPIQPTMPPVTPAPIQPTTSPVTPTPTNPSPGGVVVPTVPLTP